MPIKTILLSLSFSALLFAAFLVAVFLPLRASWISDRAFPADTAITDRKDPAAASPASATTTIMFTGDIMLARDVESRLDRETNGYAFAALDSVLRGDLVVGNFEGAIPSVHKPTPSMVLRFSVRPDLAARLAPHFTNLSLANNHALDFGEAGYAHTKETLEGLGFAVAGHPSRIASSSVFEKRINDYDVLLVAINATYGYPDIKYVLAALPQPPGSYDLPVAYVHWGEEYETTHDARQAAFAHQLIDAGFRLVVGHHPHVVQDIEAYQDGLIFYSLGNFIFDQYWNADVQQGLLLRLVSGQAGGRVELLPVESQTTRVQPREMAADRREEFLAGLAERSSANLRAGIAKGEISLQF